MMIGRKSGVIRPLLLVIAVLLYTPVLVSGSQGNAPAFSFYGDAVEETVQLEGENLSAYSERADKLLYIDGTDAVPLNRIMEGQGITIDFFLQGTSWKSHGEVPELQNRPVALQLSKDPVYWRFSSENITLGVGNRQLSSEEKLRELLLQEIKGMKAEFKLSPSKGGICEAQMTMKKNREKGFAESWKLTRSKLPFALSSAEVQGTEEGYLGSLELMANYEFSIPLVLKGGEQDAYSPVIQGKLTIVVRMEVYND